MNHLLKHILAKSAEFDELDVAEFSQQNFSIRVANNSICRENLQNEKKYLSVFGVRQSSGSSFVDSSYDGNILDAKIHSMQQELKELPPNQEYVAPQRLIGEYSWNPCVKAFIDLFSPEHLYPIINRNIEKVKKLGLRTSGYINAVEILKKNYSSHGLYLARRNMGINIKYVVDNPLTNVSGVGKTLIPASLFNSTTKHSALLELMEQGFNSALDEALNVCQQANNPGEIKPGDYQVILSPSATMQLLTSAAGYAFFDKRAIDEGRTFLSKAIKEIKFPEDISVNFGDILQIDAHNNFAPCPFNSRLVYSKPVIPVQNGRINQLFTTPYWAHKCNIPESFSINDVQTLNLNCADNSNTVSQYPKIEQLIANTKHAIYVKDLWYIRIVSSMEGILTGMTRDGVFEIRDGKIIRPLKNLRWHQNPLLTISNINACTKEKALLGEIESDFLASIPAIRSDAFHFSSSTRF